MEVGVMEDRFLGLTAQIVSAHVANNTVPMQQIPTLIREVHRALATVGYMSVGSAKAKPAVEANKSIFADHILCLDCGGSFKTLKRHLFAEHQMTPDAYRGKWDLPLSYPMVAPEYAAMRSRLRKGIGLGRKAKAASALKTRGRPKRGSGRKFWANL
jgi:MucR family transcriptional regulator, transcriptional regulator of exopolysaccharide biosynthesis